MKEPDSKKDKQDKALRNIKSRVVTHIESKTLRRRRSHSPEFPANISKVYKVW